MHIGRGVVEERSVKRIDRFLLRARRAARSARSRSPRRAASMAPLRASRILPTGKRLRAVAPLEHGLGLRPAAQPEQPLGGECVEVPAEAAVESGEMGIGGGVEHLVDRILVAAGVEQGDAEVEHGERSA